MILVFVDGLGLGVDDPAVNPLARPGAMPNLERWIGKPCTASAFPWANAWGGGAAVDAVLGVPGLPQSATGQVTLLTGVNAQSVLGRHQNGFPGRRLRAILEEKGIFKQLAVQGLTGTFANAFTAEYFAAVATGRWRYSVTTYSALAGGIRLRFLAELLAGQAVFQDLTGEILRERGYDVPIITPEEAGVVLAGLARDYAFTLFEYFQTDVAGHGQEMGLAARRLADVDRFLGALAAGSDPATDLILLASDHGNIEDLSTRGHTANPVPVLALGVRAVSFLSGLARLDQVAPRIIEMLTKDETTT